MGKSKYKFDKSRKAWSTLVWDGTFDSSGKKHRKRLSSKKSSADLERQVAEFKQKIRSNGNPALWDMTFTEYAQHWLSVSKATKESNTKKMYQNAVNHFSVLENVKISQIRHTNFQEVINLNLSHPRTCEQIALTFRQVIKLAIKDKILPRSAYEEICDGVSLPKYKRPEKRAMTPVEKKALKMACLDARKRAFTSLLFFCGLRRGEALALTPFDFDWKNKTVSINKVIIYASGSPELKPYPKSARGVRKVPIPDDAIPEIKPFVVSSSGGFIFHGKENEMMTESAYRRMWESIIYRMNRAAGFRPGKINASPAPVQGLTAHVFRHNYCTELCYQVPEISTKMIARMMGDTEKMVLTVYSHVCEEKENIRPAIDRAFG